VEHKLKTISTSGIAEALSKAQLYRYLREPEESESICQDILAADPDNQAALRLLGLSITDQFTGDVTDRCAEVEAIFRRLTAPYGQHYYLGILSERRAKAQMRAGRPGYVVVALIEEAMRYFDEAEKIRPAANEEAILRWNRCARLLAKLPHSEAVEPSSELEDHDTPPVPTRARTATVRR
jgi:tetratricopeptide (TPR) repeat protein